MTWQASWRVTGRTAAVIVIGMGGLLVLGLALAGAGISGGSMLFASGQGCNGTGGSAVVTSAVQPAPSKAAGTSIPADYLQLYQNAGHTYGVPWTILAGIGARQPGAVTGRAGGRRHAAPGRRGQHLPVAAVHPGGPGRGRGRGAPVRGGLRQL